MLLSLLFSLHYLLQVFSKIAFASIKIILERLRKFKDLDESIIKKEQDKYKTPFQKRFIRKGFKKSCLGKTLCIRYLYPQSNI